ncbi:MAG TPA: hypothetical protein VHM90_02070, partial [Phycisphaerae bacterium]|nr:hypothetical protein [Phycisphaerae bacterium]
DPARRQRVIGSVSGMMRDQIYQRQALEILLRWSAKDDTPALRNALESMITTGPGGNDVRNPDQAMQLAQKIVSFGDAGSASLLVRLLKMPSTRDGAHDLLITMGEAAEPAILEAMPTPAAPAPAPTGFPGRGFPPRPSANTAGDEQILDILASIGTEKSIMPLQRIISGKDPALSAAATESLRKLATRLKLKPDQYLSNLINRYTIVPPTGFTADTTMTDPNTRRWIRQSAGRAVKSIFTVQVSLIPSDYRIKPVPGGQTIKAQGLDFQATDPAATAPQFTRMGRLQAIDGEYLIDVTAIADTSDASAQNNITDAIKKIKVK